MKRAKSFAFACILLFIIIALPKLLMCYNVDTKYPIEFKGAANSFFGYSLSLLKARNTNWLIVGAPKANSSSLSNINEPGEILKCEITLSRKTSCSALFLDDESQRPRKGRTENSWLGVNVDSTQVENGRVVACAHRWIDKSIPIDATRNPIGYPVRGICYTSDFDFRENSVETLSPLTRSDEYSFAQIGISAHFIKNSDTLLMGAPAIGVRDFRGSAVSMSREFHNLENSKSYGNPRTFNAIPPIEYDSYFGYAVTSGNFETNGVLFVIGAPRQKYFGEVYIMSTIVRDIRKASKDFDVKVKKTGEQMGEYFGSSLCAIDFNNDGLDDLLVGAPLHSRKIDEGKVYVFINRGSLQLQSVDQGLMGSILPYARFGSTITNIGDINMDTFPDVAIGAPFEEERGAVYIYHGSPNRFKPQFQRILASVASPNARGFGVAISRAVDVDDNFYPDIVIGSFNSDQAFLFRSRPIVYLSGSLYSNVLQFNLESNIKCSFGNQKYSCFKTSVCLSYNGSHVPSSLTVNMTLAVDLRNEYRKERVLIKIDNRKSNATLSKIVTLERDKQICENFEIMALTTPIDFYTPILIKLNYTMIEEPSTNKFCSNCPMVDKPEENRKFTTVRFLKHCGEDNDNCVSDVRVKAQFIDLETGEGLIIGSRERLQLKVEVFNSAEPAYATRIIVQVPEWMTIDLIPPNCMFFLEEQREPHLDCLVANPLKQNVKIPMIINLNIQKVPVRNGLIKVNVNATSDSSEKNENDNHVRLSLPVTVQADITVVGTTDTRQIVYYTDERGKILDGNSANFTHSYEIINKGPSTVNLITIEVHYPSQTIQHDDLQVMEIISIDNRNGLKEAVFGSCEQSGDSSSLNPPRVPESINLEGDAVPHHQRLRRELIDDSNGTNTTDPIKSKNYFQMNCSTFRCKTLKCTVGPFKKNTEALLMVMFSINLPILRTLTDEYDGVVVTSEGLVSLFPSNIQPKEHLTDQAFVSTEVQPVRAPAALPVAAWIIPVSIICGFLLLLLLSMGLVKLGFFRRKNKEDLEKLKNDYADQKSSPQDPGQSSHPDQEDEPYQPR